ncbi:MAG TPA: protein ndvB, partial [Polyangiaceae bacterium]|nr:protein ndvB [Polyangiaceae bacterium]
MFEPAAACFMGWERKRGKIAEFNRLLRGAVDTTFTRVTAPTQLLARIRYVITLDTDTELPLGVARRLVAAIAHPLNRPWLDERRQRVRRGHAIIQPRVGTSPMSARQSAFARLAAGPPGIDPYTTAVSDVYQDLFGQGSFVGKGIYEVDAFEAATRGRFPTNQLLSHDLIESIYARAALASDIEVLDEQPAAYSVAAGRNHRWMRGDWQLLPWLWPRVPAQTGTRRFDFSWFDAWRVVDNLRRSLLSPALVVLATVSWLSGFGTALVGSLLLLAVFVVPVVGRLVFAFARADSQLDWLGGLGGDLKTNAQQAFLSLTFLLDQALVSADAIVRANYRQFVSRRGMLEWTSMRDAARRSGNSVLRVPRLLAGSTLSLGILGAVGWCAPRAVVFAGPVLLLWASSPWVSVWVSRVQPSGVAQPWGAQELRAFRRVARKTWRFFERFVGDLDHHLPPDNFQEDPRGVVAHRTSPTNIGLYLLSVGSARDLAFIPLDEAMQRWDRTLTTIERLEKREGHVLNWY